MNPDEPMNETYSEEELVDNLHFDVNIPFPRNRVQGAQPGPVGRYYLGEWSRAEREYRSASESRDGPVQAEGERFRVERENRSASESREGVGQVAGAGRSSSPVPPLPFAPNDLVDEDSNNEDHLHDLAHAMDNINMVHGAANDERHMRHLYDIDPMTFDTDFSLTSPPPEPHDTYKP
ncbi:unnamed protein product, partial [Brenthis ino]